MGFTPRPLSSPPRQDDGVSVREAAVELLAKHITSDPALADDYFGVIVEASTVGGAGGGAPPPARPPGCRHGRRGAARAWWLGPSPVDSPLDCMARAARGG